MKLWNRKKSADSGRACVADSERLSRITDTAVVEGIKTKYLTQNDNFEAS